MIENTSQIHLRARLAAWGHRARFFAARRPAVAAAVLLACGTVAGAGTMALARPDHGPAAQAQQAELARVQHQSQLEINAMSARLAELQAQANRLNALGQRLARSGQLADGEFDFGKTPGQGGAGRARDVAPADFRTRLASLEMQYRDAGTQFDVLERLLRTRQLERDALPSQSPVAGGYITSGFGGRSDPFGLGEQFHKGIDYAANIGDPVLAVADGVVTFIGERSGYGNTVEVDHGNGYVTRYAHNSALSRRVGELVRAGEEIAKAGSTGRSTGPHVHLEVWENGRVIDPMRFLRTRRG